MKTRKMNTKRGMNKRAGDFKAGLTIFILVMYFSVFSLVSSSVSNIENEANDEIIINGVEFDTLIGSKVCQNPRYYYNPETGEQLEYKKGDYDRLDCTESRGVLNQNECENIAGCYWDNVTTGFWFWSEVVGASCLGEINATNYSIDVNEYPFSIDRVSLHNNSGYWSVTSVCNHPKVFLNKTLCDKFSCSWQELDYEVSYKSSKSIFSVIGEIFTFRYNFNESNQSLNVIFNLLFIYLPLILLIISIFFILPFSSS